jgi:hypothetical protein
VFHLRRVTTCDRLLSLNCSLRSKLSNENPAAKLVYTLIKFRHIINPSTFGLLIILLSSFFSGAGLFLWGMLHVLFG